MLTVSLMPILQAFGLMRISKTHLVSRVVPALSSVSPTAPSSGQANFNLTSPITTSTMEPEYNALSTTMKSVIPLLELLKAVGKGVGMSEEQ